MTPDTLRFRSRQERENEVPLERNYGQIGISAIRAFKEISARVEPRPADAALALSPR